MAMASGLALRLRRPAALASPWRARPGGVQGTALNGADPALLHGDEVRLVAEARIGRDLSWTASEPVADLVDQRHQAGIVGGSRDQTLGKDNLAGGIHRRLGVVALDEASAGRLNPAVGVGEVALRPVGRAAILGA